MQTTRYAYRVELAIPYEEAVERATIALKAEGFGVLTEIDMQQKLKEKIGVDFCRYVILGACNPPLAHRALQAEIDLGILLPCNVVVYETEAGSSVVSAMAPHAALAVVGENAKLEAVAREADERIRNAVGSLEKT